MVEHRFGGDWTHDKLERLRGYLIAYRAIFENNLKAQFFDTWYVDAFAGTGSIASAPTESSSLSLLDKDADEDQKRFLDGSARIALSLSSPFDKYLFIEESKKRADTLLAMVNRDFAKLSDRVEVTKGDANKTLCAWCRARDWNKERAVVFLDPYGMQVEWQTIETLASTGGVDLWYLFPFATRLLRNDQKIDETWSRRLDSLFGTTDWRSRFYPLRKQETLFGESEVTERDAHEQTIQDFIEERLQTRFAAVAKSRILRNSSRSPLYALCFAAANPKGAKTALKIAQHLLGK